METRHQRRRNGGIRANEEDEEDRISRLPEDLLRHIFSFIDSKYAVQSSVLSKKWNSRRIWASLPHLNLDSRCFRNKENFYEFVTQIFTLRETRSDISTINIRYRATTCISAPLVGKLERYATCYKTQQLKIDSNSISISRRRRPVFSSVFLKHLQMPIHVQVIHHQLSNLNLPALTTLHLIIVSHPCTPYGYRSSTSKSIDLVSKLVNLKDFTLTLRDTGCPPKELVFNIVSVGLETLTINSRGNQACKFVVSTPNLMSFFYEGCYPLSLSTDGLGRLEKVSIEMAGYFIVPYARKLEDAHRYNERKKRVVQETINMFGQLRNTSFLTLIMPDTVCFFTHIVDLLANYASPFTNLKCLKLEKKLEKFPWLDNKCPPIATGDVINYFLSSSPTATVIDKA